MKKKSKGVYILVIYSFKGPPEYFLLNRRQYEAAQKKTQREACNYIRERVGSIIQYRFISGLIEDIIEEDLIIENELTIQEIYYK